MMHEAVAWHPTLESTRPFDRGLLYTLTTVGSSLMAVSLVGWAAQASAGARVTRALGATGRTTLTLYVGHVLVYNLLVHRLAWVHPDGLGTALVFAGVLAVCRRCRNRLAALARHRPTRVGVPPLQRRQLSALRALR